jgi:Subtilase family
MSFLQHDIMVGTSFSAPVVAGVIALMLQLKPELTWRDVQGIIAVEADKIDPDHPSWVTNAAGYSHSDLYGFGMIRAHESLNRASIWKSFKKEEQIVVENNGEINIADPIEASTPAAAASSTVTIPERLAVNFVTESVSHLEALRIVHFPLSFLFFVSAGYRLFGSGASFSRRLVDCLDISWWHGSHSSPGKSS